MSRMTTKTKKQRRRSESCFKEENIKHFALGRPCYHLLHFKQSYVDAREFACFSCDTSFVQDFIIFAGCLLKYT